MKALEFDGNHLYAHGAYIEDWNDEKGPIWSHVMDVSAWTARTLLEMAYVFQSGPEVYLSDLNKNPGTHWLQVGNKDFVVYHINNYGWAYAVTNRDGFLSLICGNVERIRAYVERTGHKTHQEKRLLLALDTLQYDVHDRELNSRCFM